MRTLTVVVVASAVTALNTGLWLWRPPGTSAVAMCQRLVATSPTASAPKSILNSSSTGAPSIQPPSAQKQAKGAADQSAAIVTDQPWLSMVRDGVAMAAQSQAFFDRLTLSDTQCEGSSCTFRGTTVDDGKHQGLVYVLNFAKELNSGQIAGGDTGRFASINFLGASDADGTSFTITVNSSDGPPTNPCQSVLDTWHRMHPGDFVATSVPTNATNPPPPKECRPEDCGNARP